jgi:ribosomal protein S12 methylthiotransferase accessory factor
MSLYGNHKDKLPLETVTRIRNILADTGIFTYESNWGDFTKNNHSVMLTDINIDKVSTNGKGVSREYSLASGYAEFMERLQNGILYRPSFGLMNEIKFNYPDQKHTEKNEFIKNNEELLSKICDEDYLNYVKNNQDETITTTPYFNVFEKKISYLPNEIIFKLCTSNGMCAGNTPVEAIQQGIGEILERYMLKKVFYEESFIPPTIPLSYFNKYSIYKIVTEIIKKGFNIVIKDMTYNGIYPVLGVLVFNSKRNKYKYSFASDVLIETCLQRCLTEISQGYSSSNFEHIMFDLYFDDEDCKDPRNEHFLATTSGEGKLPQKMFSFEPSDNNIFEKAFLNSIDSNKNALDYVVKIVKNSNHDLYIRDVSILDFHSYSVFIPGMSETFRKYNSKKVSKKDLPTNNKNEFNLLENLLKLESLPNADLLKVAEDLELKTSTSLKIFKEKLPIYLKSDSDLNDLPVGVLLVLIYNRLGNYNKCVYFMEKYLRENIGKNVGLENHDYYKCASYFFRLKSENMNIEDIRYNLSNIFEINLTNEIISDLNDPNDSFKYYNLPNCGDCSKCNISNECNYPEWKKIITNLVQKAKENMPNQSDLSYLFY